MIVSQSYGSLKERLSWIASLLPKLAILVPPYSLDSNSLAGPANLAGAHTGSLSVSRVGEKDDPRAIHTRGGPAVSATINFGLLMTPNDAFGNSFLCVVHCEALATKQLQLACEPAAIPSNPTIRGNHAVARRVNRHRIVVHRVADGSCAVRGSHGSAQRLVTNQCTPRDTQ